MQLTKEQWSGHVEAWRASGSSAQEYCTRRGLKVSGLRYWSSRIRREAGAELNEAVEKPRFARVRMRRSGVATARSGGLFVHVGEVRVEVGADFDADTLRRVLAVLAGGAR